MATITGANNQTVIVNVGSNDGPTGPAQLLANQISTSLQGFSSFFVASANTPPATGTGVFVQGDGVGGQSRQ